MTFSCSCDFDNDGDHYYLGNNEKPADKACICQECRKDIAAGEIINVYYFGDTTCIDEENRDDMDWDDECSYPDHAISENIKCERCGDLASAFKAVGYCFEFGELLASYRDWLDEEKKTIPQWLANHLLERRSSVVQHLDALGQSTPHTGEVAGSNPAVVTKSRGDA